MITRFPFTYQTGYSVKRNKNHGTDMERHVYFVKTTFSVKVILKIIIIVMIIIVIIIVVIIMIIIIRMIIIIMIMILHCLQFRYGTRTGAGCVYSFESQVRAQ